MIISDLNYLEEVVEAIEIKGGSFTDTDSVLKWADNLVNDLDKTLKPSKTVKSKNKAAKSGKVEKKVEKKSTGKYASVSSSLNYYLS